MADDREFEIHRSWLGLLQPVGLVVSPRALVAAQTYPDRTVTELQEALKEVCDQRRAGPLGEPEPCLLDFPAFVTRVLGWRADDLAEPVAQDGDGTPLEVVLPDYHETLRPDYVVRDFQTRKPVMLVRRVDVGTSLDDPPSDSDTGWHASPQGKFERLLRECTVPTGLLCNGHALRLVYAPRGETAGHLTFPVPALTEVAGRPILAALRMLLGEERVFSATDKRCLVDILADSRRYQSEVSTRLASQVLGSLWELLRGFQAADEVSGGAILSGVAKDEPEHVYGGLLTVLLRTVFLLYAEDKGLIPADPVYVNNYSLTGLYQRLRDDAGQWPDTMDHRFGAWAWLVSLFRLVHDGGGHADMRLPARHGRLFSPNIYPFLEGRSRGDQAGDALPAEVPHVSDGCVYRVLDALLVLEGERLSYGALDVEQLGSVYEAMMGFAVERARGRAIGVCSDGQKKGAVRADTVVDLEELLGKKPAERKKWLQEIANCDLGAKEAAALQAATTAEGAVAALGRKVSRYTPQIIPRGALYLQPGEERRRSGSHYTPRELTEPIVRTTLRPVLEALGPHPTPEQTLDLKVCDPAMGSGAFLVEACRQLADVLVESWEFHQRTPKVPPDEEAVLHARRLVAQRCLYGVDKNPFAVNLAKLSLWLITLARDHAFTFLDHALKCGDSLVGLAREQIEAFRWKMPKSEDAAAATGEGTLFAGSRAWLDAARDDRSCLAALADEMEEQKVALLLHADGAVDDLRLAGDLVVATFFAGTTDREREAKRLAMRARVDQWRHKSLGREQLEESVRHLRSNARPLIPLHWDIEFPEVFARERPGFDAIVGNPPFAGVVQASGANRHFYTEYLREVTAAAGGKSDLCAFFFRRAYTLIRDGGAMGLIATNTIAQGDTRTSGLTHICETGGLVYEVEKRIPWPGCAAVIVSAVHVAKDAAPGMVRRINGRLVSRITAFLLDRGDNNEPKRLMLQNICLATKGVVPYGMGFVFEDGKPECSSLQIMRSLLTECGESSLEVVHRFIGGSDLNSHPTQTPERFIIDFREMSEHEARHWPVLFRVVEERVKPGRMALSTQSGADVLKRDWWLFGYRAKELRKAIAGLKRVLVCSQTSKYLSFAFLPSDWVFDQKVVVFAGESHQLFAVVQSRIHGLWAQCFGSTLEERPVYTPSDCFETFPFPPNWQSDPTLEAAGQAYYDFRAALMIRNNEGLTNTYNRFHDPDEHDPNITKLRELHVAMDRAVLGAYGWHDISTECRHILAFESDEETSGTKKKPKKKPWRYRWPDDVHDEVLARLLDLNHRRAEEERLAGKTTGRSAKASKGSSSGEASNDGKPRPPSKTPPRSGDLLLFPEVD